MTVSTSVSSRLRTLNPAEACMAGLAAQEAGDNHEAVLHFERALQLAPSLIDVRLLLAFALGATDDERARAVLDGTPDIETLPIADLRRFADAAVQLGAAQSALKVVRLLNQKTPADPDVQSTLGALLQRTGAVDEARHVLQRAVLRWPNHVPALLNNANLVFASGAYSEALQYFDRALRLEPSHASARWHRGMLRLTMGDFAGGWQDHEARRALPVHVVNIPKGVPAWNGRNMRGRTVLLWGEQGLGDQIQGVRFASLLAEGGANVIVRCAAPLKHLFQSVAGVSRVITEGDAVPRCDAHVPMLSVPFLLKLFNENDYQSAAYLDGEVRAHTSNQRSNGDASSHGRGQSQRPYVGVAWAGSPGHTNDAKRSMPSSFLPPLLDCPNAAWVSLQVGVRSRDLKRLPAAALGNVTDVSPSLTNFVDTAHVLASLDRVVTVDTSVAHLAGALGVPTLLLLPFVPDWRWQLAREDSPWYRSVRIVRQASADDWDSVIARVHRELAAGGQARAD